MKRMYRSIPALLVLAALAILFAGCTTVNRLGKYEVEGAALAADLRIPPQPKIDVDYHVGVDSRNPVRTFVSVGSSVAKASEASKAGDRMRSAMKAVDVPAIFREEAIDGAVEALEARLVLNRKSAEYFLDLEIREYGIDAQSSSGHVYFDMNVAARLYHSATGRLVWRRHIGYHEAASPRFFGIADPVGNVITAGVLSELSEERMKSGFEKMAHEAAVTLARRLERDLYKVRY